MIVLSHCYLYVQNFLRSSYLIVFFIVKIERIFNLTGQNTVHIFDVFVFTVQISMKCIARKIEGGNKKFVWQTKSMKNFEAI